MDKLKQAWNYIKNVDALERTIITTNHKGEKTIILDLHDLSYENAKRLVRNTVNLTDGPFRLRVLHGDNFSTAIRKLVRRTYENSRIKERVAVPWNPDETYLRIA